MYMKKRISILIPVCNEEKNIPIVIDALKSVFEESPYEHTVTFIDDGSNDHTLEILKKISAVDPQIFFIRLSRNFGHQNALKAGIDSITEKSDAVIMMDGDLQHPPELIPVMLQKWEEGFDVVYTIRKDDTKVPLLKKKTSSLFYDLLNKVSDIELDTGAADFRILDKKVIPVFKNFNESDLFLRGLSKWVGFRQVAIEYTPGVRFNGQSKYTIKKMIRFALQGITSFSTKPLYIAAYLGFAFSMLSLLYIPYIIYSYFFEKTISGWTSLIATIAFFGGLQLMILGIIGLYLGKLFMQSKNRPHYIIRESNL
ncbi:dolichol-phosphate mannosyltransferase [Sediminibacterium goheungense]|uniref:Dolichol-phosphate mannosyltransferase n=2 Tax=Sediminibacterium goheungense TaxID=1086393 RepID=A0A4R6J477_9BACT|nr:dolichol-phosphate mannosyltransferase [Sediminibacterium goheungense]